MDSWRSEILFYVYLGGKLQDRVMPVIKQQLHCLRTWVMGPTCVNIDFDILLSAKVLSSAFPRHDQNCHWSTLTVPSNIFSPIPQHCDRGQGCWIVDYINSHSAACPRHPPTYGWAKPTQSRSGPGLKVNSTASSVSPRFAPRPSRSPSLSSARDTRANSSSNNFNNNAATTAID